MPGTSHEAQGSDVPKRRWIVRGAKRDTGEPVSISVVSRSAERAKRLVEDTGITVDRVEHEEQHDAAGETLVAAPAVAQPRRTSIQEPIPGLDLGLPVDPPSRTAPAPTFQEEPEATPVRRGMACLLCGSRFVRRRSVYRMSTPVVWIGLILLVPSVLGMVICLAAMVLNLFSAGQPKGLGEAMPTVQIWLFAMFVASFVSGLLGWLLVMKRNVLACEGCGAAFDAV